ncbi:MAG: LPS export ABC transporter periplasmic protein LptC [Kiritimatiellia bacterium]
MRFRHRQAATWIASGALWLAAALPGFTAEDGEHASEMEDVVWPRYEDGKLKSRLSADKAVRDGDVIKARGVTVEVFDESGEREIKVMLKECVYDTAAEKVSSKNAVRLDGRNIVITGKGLKWDSAKTRVSVLDDVMVVLKEGAWREMLKEAPAETKSGGGGEP